MMITCSTSVTMENGSLADGLCVAGGPTCAAIGSKYVSPLTGVCGSIGT